MDTDDNRPALNILPVHREVHVNVREELAKTSSKDSARIGGAEALHLMQHAKILDLSLLELDSASGDGYLNAGSHPPGCELGANLINSSCAHTKLIFVMIDEPIMLPHLSFLGVGHHALP